MRVLCPLAVLLLSLPASAVTMDWVAVGSPGNACDPQFQGCFGAVDYSYRISKYEVTNAQYAEFLNAVATTDPYDLYNPSMGNPGPHYSGGITRSGSPGSYSYSVIPWKQNDPVNWVSFYDALRFVNWMSNGQGNGDTESGSYSLLGGTVVPTNGTTVTRTRAHRSSFPPRTSGTRPPTTTHRRPATSTIPWRRVHR